MLDDTLRQFMRPWPIAAIAIEQELERAQSKFPAFNSAHEGLAVIMEELEELKEEVFKKPEDRDYSKLEEESIQLAAMAARFFIDIVLERK